MSDDQSGLLITLPGRPENVAVVRHAVAGLAEQLGMEEPGLSDLKTVVTEACMNVVVHAYGDETGPLQVEAIPDGGELLVVVRDFGLGIRPRPDLDRPSLRIGLTLIAALANSFEISGGLNRGTEIRMHLPLVANLVDGPESLPQRDAYSGQAAEMSIGRPELVGPVLGRVVGALAARRQITVDRLADAVLLTDAISERAPDAFTDGQVCLGVSDDANGIDLRIGPMSSGASERLRDGLALPEEVGGSLESLADELVVEAGEAGEYLVVRFAALPV